MSSEHMARHFQLLEEQRHFFYHDTSVPFEVIWQRPLPNKWSIGETLYHLYAMIRLFRRFSNLYIPLMTPVATLRQHKRYKPNTYDIYKEYQTIKLKGMNAPKLIQPPKDIAGKYELVELQRLLNMEAEKLAGRVKNIPDDIAGHIVYFDPVAHHPNLLQSIHLLAIHEQHHFDLTKAYFQNQ